MVYCAFHYNIEASPLMAAKTPPVAAAILRGGGGEWGTVRFFQSGEGLVLALQLSGNQTNGPCQVGLRRKPGEEKRLLEIPSARWNGEALLLTDLSSVAEWQDAAVYAARAEGRLRLCQERDGSVRREAIVSDSPVIG